MVRTFLPQISLLVLVGSDRSGYANSVPDFRGNLPAVCKRQLCRNDCSDHRNLFRSRYQPAFYRRRHHHVLLLQRTGNYHRRNEQDVLYPVPVICGKCVCKCIDVCAGRIQPWGIILKIKTAAGRSLLQRRFLLFPGISRFFIQYARSISDHLHWYRSRWCCQPAAGLPG